MAIFIRGNINQGDECFNVKSRGKQCAFNSLLRLITAGKKLLTQWSPTTLNNILVQGDKMYLKVMNNHLIDLPPGVVHLSVKDLPKLVIVSRFENEFNFDICCQSVENPDLHIEAQSIFEPPIVVSNVEPPLGVSNVEPPLGVSNVEQPLGVSNVEPPLGVSNVEPPFVVSNVEPPLGVSYVEPPLGVSYVEPPLGVSNVEPPLGVSNVEPADLTNNLLGVSNERSNFRTNNEEVTCVIDYKQELQGLVVTNEEIPSHYYKMHIAIANIFVKYKYAFMILESYMMALIKHMECFYLIDPHARNCLGMLDPNGTAVVMQFANMLNLEQYLYTLSEALHSKLFEIVPVQFTEIVLNRLTKNVNFFHSVRLLKNREFQQAKRSKENDCEKQNRLQNMREYISKKRCEESDLARQTRLNAAKLSQKRKRSVETDLDRQKRLKKDRLYQRSNNKQAQQAQSKCSQMII